MTESPKPPSGPAPRAASAFEAGKPLVTPGGARAVPTAPSSGPPPPPLRAPVKPARAGPADREQTASLPRVVRSGPAGEPGPAAEREEARDTLAPSSFGVLGGSRPNAAPPPTGVRSARSPLPTLGELEGSSATATLRPPGAVPPPPRGLPTPTPNLAAVALEQGSALDTPLPATPHRTGPLVTPRAQASPRFESSTVVSGGVSAPAAASEPHAASSARISGVPAPGLFIADEPLEPRPKQASVVTEQSRQIGRMRAVLLVLGGLLLMAAGALVVLIFRRAEASANRQAPAPASAAAKPPGCELLAPPSRISSIERTVPISALALANGNVALAAADTKRSAIAFVYDPLTGDAQSKPGAPEAEADVSHVTAGEPLVVDRGSPDFAFAHTLAPGLALGVGPSGILRRGNDGATGVVWPIDAGVRVTPPRVVTLPSGHFVTFRQGGAQGQIIGGWLRPDGAAATGATALEGIPPNLGTPSAAPLGDRAVVLFSARADKSEPYRIFAASAAPGHVAGPARVLDVPSEGGGAIAPALAALPGGRYLLQWTDGNVGQYRVHARIFDAALAPLSPALLLSAKGANAGQGTLVSTSKAAVSFFIQTTAGHDELWGVALSCH